VTDGLSSSPFRAEIVDAVSGLNAARSAWRERQAERAGVARFPSPEELAKAVEHLSSALFPARLGGFRGGAAREDDFVAEQLDRGLAILRDQVASELDYWQAHSSDAFDADQADTIIRHFAVTLPEIRTLVDSDVEAAFVGDPAARSVDEILISYPGALAVLHHRIAHQLHTLGAAIVARVVSELANARTGIDIHPGATIGPRFFIDHGTGVVIGETAIIGSNVRLYQHVTLGARSPLGLERVGPRERFARHPIVEDDVVIYAGATILGRVTIGRGSTIGGNVWLLEDVPPESVVVQPEAIRLHDADAAGLAALLSGHGR
jgi:serine O-acetyltransferase